MLDWVSLLSKSKKPFDGKEQAIYLLFNWSQQKVIRTLQTIYPFSKESNIKVNVDYSLSEIQQPDLITPNSFHRN